jgi:hypothetical protein
MAVAKIKVSDLVTKQNQSWALADQTQIELYRFLTEVLRADPAHNLMRVTSPFDGMVAQCVRRDPVAKDRDHEFTFRVYFGQDEDTLYITRGDYEISEPE